jgi:hypothetical protein
LFVFVKIFAPPQGRFGRCRGERRVNFPLSVASARAGYLPGIEPATRFSKAAGGKPKSACLSGALSTKPFKTKEIIVRKLSRLAGLVLMGVMLVSIAPASAAPYSPHKTMTPDSTVCTAICGAPALAAGDVVRTSLDAVDPCMPRLAIGGVAQPTRVALTAYREALDAVKGSALATCGGQAQLSDCTSPLGQLPKVSEREVRSVDRHDRIKLIPICDRLNASLTQVQHNLAETGNANTLVPAIADNAVLTAALGHARYSADDVVGIVMGTNSVMLYVHKM